MYEKGGVFMISSMILQLDFLQNHLPYNKVAGILVFDAHRLSPGCVELFCLLLFRHRCHGFVKCFSDNANACCSAFPQLSSFLNELTVPYLFLYPRNRDTVIESLSKSLREIPFHPKIPLNRGRVHLFLQRVDAGTPHQYFSPLDRPIVHRAPSGSHHP